MEQRNNSRTIIAVAEGRRNTCGLVEVDLQYPLAISLCATSESSATWHDTINTVYKMNPDVICLPVSQRQTVLSQELQDSINCEFKFLGRKSFNQATGLAEFQRLSMSFTADPGYLEAAALKALLDYCGDEEDCLFADSCISFEQASPSGRLLMDRATLENLEIVRNRRTGHRKGSLLGIFLPSCGSGARLLRKTLMSPVCEAATLNARYDTVALLQQNPTTMRKLRQKLNRTNLEQICRLLAFIPRKLSPVTSARSISGVLGLVDLLNCLPTLAKVVENLCNLSQSQSQSQQSQSQSQPESESLSLLKTSKNNLSNPLFSDMLNMIKEGMALNSLDGSDGGEQSDQGSKKRKGYNEKQRREIFCVKPGLSGPLDVSRATYLLCLSSIDTLFDKYVDSWSIVGMELKHEKNAIVIRMPLGSSDHLPHDLDIQRRTKKYMVGTTKELGSLVKRVQECVHECYHHTFAAIQDLLSNIRSQIKAISSIADTLAFLDLVSTFAQVSLNSNYTRPEINTRMGTIAIQHGRHPVAERLPGTNFVPNNVLLTAGHGFQLVLGPNSAGKSTYLRTVALTVVLAQSGCFVPATRCQLQLRDRILTRLSCEDDTEKNLSTFQLEASEAALITRSLTPHSLILFDEFGRSTSSKEALSLSYAVAEYLINTPALTLFATHFRELQSLSSTTESCFTSYFQFSEDSSNHSRHYSHKLIHGQPKNGNISYGIEHAQYCGWPMKLVQQAREVRKMLMQSEVDATATSLERTRNTAHGTAEKEIIQRMILAQSHASSNLHALPVIKELLRSLQRL